MCATLNPSFPPMIVGANGSCFVDDDARDGGVGVVAVVVHVQAGENYFSFPFGNGKIYNLIVYDSNLTKMGQF